MFNADGFIVQSSQLLSIHSESRSRFCEFLLRFRGAVDASSTFGTFFVHFRMTVKIVFQTVCHQFPLGDGRDAVGHVLLYLGQQQRKCVQPRMTVSICVSLASRLPMFLRMK